MDMKAIINSHLRGPYGANGPALHYFSRQGFVAEETPEYKHAL
jgi:hypothetical protein